MAPNDVTPRCRQCPDGNFDLTRVGQSRFMAICHAVECILDPKFPDNNIIESHHISKANIQTVVFEPIDNCPHVEKLRREGLLPWATSTINFIK